MVGLYSFGELKLFPSATGQHNMITLLRKGKKERPVLTFSTNRQGSIDESHLRLIVSGSDPQTEYRQVPQRELFKGDEYFIQLPQPTQSVATLTNDMTFDFEKIDRQCQSLSNYTEHVFMGVQTGCDVVTDSLISVAIAKGLLTVSQANRYDIGAGIYVLTFEELQRLNLTTPEMRDCVKPFYKNSEIGRYFTPKSRSRYLLYVDSQSDIDLYPNIRAHLQKYRPLLAAREQAVTEDHNWFWIRGSKRESFSYRPDTIVVPYRATTSRFSLCNRDIFGAGDVYYIALKRGLSTKSLSLNLTLAPTDDGTSEIQQGEIITGFLLPTDEQSAKTIDP